jgi:hypothetical protein
MPKSRPITEKELDAIKRSVAAARERFLAERPSYVYRSPSGWHYSLTEYEDKPDILEWFRKGWKFKRIATHHQRILTKLQIFLLDHWAESKDGLPELFYLTPAALLELCRRQLNFRNLSEATLIKTRQRLGLRPFKRQKRSAVFRGGSWKFPQVDKR